MKFIFFDIDSETLLSKDGRVRPFMDLVLEYCHFSKIRVYLAVSPDNTEWVEHFYKVYDADNNAWAACPVFTKGGAIPDYPDLVISCNNDYLKKWPGLLIPPYDPDRSNKFADVALAGRLLDVIKNKVVLRREAPEKKPVEKEPPKNTSTEDFSSWAFEV